MRPQQSSVASPVAQGLLLAAGFAGIYAAAVVVSAITGIRFEIPNDGGGRGIGLPATWFHAAIFAALTLTLWFTGRRWDAPAFAALRQRRPWLVPVVVGVVVVPLGLALIFVLVA